MATNLFHQMKWGQAPDFDRKRLLILRCLGEEFLMRLRNFPVYGVSIRMCHVSFPDDVDRKWGALLLDRDGRWKSQARTTIYFDVPLLISIEESCFSEWVDVTDQQEADNSEELEYSSGNVITKWRVISTSPSAAASSRRTTGPRASSFVPKHMPAIPPGYCSHCDGASTSIPTTTTVAATTTITTAMAASTATTATMTSTITTATVTTAAAAATAATTATATTATTTAATDNLAAEIIKLAGTHKEMRYQRTLQSIQEGMLIHKMNFPIKLEFQPDNPMDINAIAVFGFVNGQWEELGTIPKLKIKKITKAIRRKEMYSVKLQRAPYSEAVMGGVYPVTLSCSLVVVKRGVWEGDSGHYSYNDNLSNI